MIAYLVLLLYRLFLDGKTTNAAELYADDEGGAVMSAALAPPLICRLESNDWRRTTSGGAVKTNDINLQVMVMTKKYLLCAFTGIGLDTGFVRENKQG